MKKISKLVKELDKWFSLFIRLRESKDGYCECFTCGKQDHYKKLQNGHFQSRKHYSTRWNEKNCQVQCVACNMFNQGEQYKFAVALDNKYGSGSAAELEALARTTTKFMRSDYMENISYYKKAVNNFLQSENID